MNDSYIEYVDSDYRVSGTSSNFIYKIDLPRNFNRCAVVSASIPKTWYLVQAGYNTFTVTEASGTRTITIPVGDYNINTYRTTLLALLNVSTYTYDVSISSLTTKLTYTVSGNSGYQPTFTFPNTSVLYRLMGFEFNDTVQFTANTLVSDNIPFYQHTNVIFIRSNLQSSESSSLSGDILQQITAIANSQLSAITYNAVDIVKQSKPFRTGASVFNFRITDADGFPLDLNGIPVNFEIVFYNVDNTNEILKGKAFLDNLEALKSGRV